MHLARLKGEAKTDFSDASSHALHKRDIPVRGESIYGVGQDAFRNSMHTSPTHNNKCKVCMEYLYRVLYMLYYYWYYIHIYNRCLRAWVPGRYRISLSPPPTHNPRNLSTKLSTYYSSPYPPINLASPPKRLTTKRIFYPPSRTQLPDHHQDHATPTQGRRSLQQKGYTCMFTP